MLKRNNAINEYHSVDIQELSISSFRRAVNDYCSNINKELSESLFLLTGAAKYQSQLVTCSFPQSMIQDIKNATAPFKEISAVLSQTSAQFAPIHKQLSDISSLCSHTSVEISNSLNRNIQDLMRSSISIENTFQSMFQPIVQLQLSWINQFGDVFRGIHENLEKIKVTAEEADEILKKYKWLISPSLPFKFASVIIKINNDTTISKRSKYHQINKTFVTYLSRDNYTNLKDIVDSWEDNPLFNRRRKIFHDSVALLKAPPRRVNTNNFILPTLIAQIDGILSDYLKMKGWDYVFNPKAKRYHWKDTSGADLNEYSSNVQCYRKIYSDDGEVFESPNFLLMDILFQSAYHGQELKRPFTLSRHKIMHGEYLKYGRLNNTLRSFLILDFLAALK